MNELLFIFSIVAVFTGVVLVNRLFGKTGVMTWAVVMSVLANLITPKQVTIFGFDVAMGAVLFSAVFLCLDILNECYGEKYSKRTVLLCLCSSIFFVATMQIVLLFSPNAFDYAHGAMSELYSLSMRITIASIVMFFLSTLGNVYLFSFIKRYIPKGLWLRSNVSTIVCNCTENFFFVLIAFFGIYPLEECIAIALATCFVEVIVGICDTPFLYWARRSKKKLRQSPPLPRTPKI